MNTTAQQLLTGIKVVDLLLGNLDLGSKTMISSPKMAQPKPANIIRMLIDVGEFGLIMSDLTEKQHRESY